MASRTAAANCGAVELALYNNRAKVRVSDIVYDLNLRSDGQLDLLLAHGSVLIDVFTAPYNWDGRVLRFVDPERGVAYRVRFGTRATDRPAVNSL